LEDDQNESVEESVNEIVKFYNDELQLDVSPKDVDIAHRLGRFNESHPRTIICKGLGMIRAVFGPQIS